MQSVRKQSEEEFMPVCPKKTVKFLQKIIVCAAISVHGTSRLHFVKDTMEAVTYIEVLKGSIAISNKGRVG